jgi:hypothetical protein
MENKNCGQEEMGISSDGSERQSPSVTVLKKKKKKKKKEKKQSISTSRIPSWHA